MSGMEIHALVKALSRHFLPDRWNLNLDDFLDQEKVQCLRVNMADVSSVD